MTPVLLCLSHKKTLATDRGDAFVCPEGCRFPVVNGIPRFVEPDNYASAFGLQWNAYRTTQLDSHSGLTISRDRLTRLVGGSREVLRGKRVLEAGCGAGRFTEVLLASGAEVFAADLSSAVEANRANCGASPGYFVCQADIRKLPVPPASFDVVICIGVIQHTPDPEETIAALCGYVKPGGMLVIDHYTQKFLSRTPFREKMRSLMPQHAVRRALRSYLLDKPLDYSMRFCRNLTSFLWPLHRGSWKLIMLPGLRTFALPHDLRKLALGFSPIADHHEFFPELSGERLYEWAVLDTHDMLTDRYKHLRSVEEIEECLAKCGMEKIEASYAGNGVEARARKPVTSG